MVPCSRLDHTDEFVSNCIEVVPGGSCTTTCAEGWSTWFPWVTRESEFTCPLRNLDAETQPHGVNPRCSFFDSWIEAAVVVGVAVAVVAAGTWLVTTLITGGSGCCCCAITGRVVYNKGWNKLQNEIVEAMEAGKVVDALKLEIQELEGYFDKGCCSRMRRCIDCRGKKKVQGQLDAKQKELAEAEKVYEKELQDVDAQIVTLADADGDGKVSSVELQQFEIDRLSWQIKELELYFAGGCWGCLMRCIDCKSDAGHRKKIQELRTKRTTMEQQLAKDKLTDAKPSSLYAAPLEASAPERTSLYPLPLASPTPTMDASASGSSLGSSGRYSVGAISVAGLSSTSLSEGTPPRARPYVASV